jgi:hypothetical protein
MTHQGDEEKPVFFNNLRKEASPDFIWVLKLSTINLVNIAEQNE